MHLVVGLGNPGPEYADSRHNVGFMIVDAFAVGHRAGRWRRAFRAQIAEARMAGRRLTLAKPLTFMNLAGESVAPLARHLGAPPGEILVVHDDKDLPAGVLRLKVGGGDAGHKGVRSVMEQLADDGFYRLRVGIGPPPPGLEVSDYVLEPADQDTRLMLRELVAQGTEALAMVLAQGPERAMTTINRRTRPDEGKQA